MNVFIVVRFSLRFPLEWEQQAFGSVGRDLWFEERAKLAEAMLLSSLSAQVYPVTLMLLMDTFDRGLYFRCFSQDSKEMIVPCFLKKDKSFARELSVIIKGLGGNSPGIVCRVDSDDAIHREYSSWVRNHYAMDANRGKFAVFANGFRTDLVRVQPMDFPNGPFVCAYVSTPRKFESVRLFQHHRLIPESERVAIRSPDPMWVQLIHAGNIKNKLTRPYMRADFDGRILDESFGIDSDKVRGVLSESTVL